MLPHGLLFPGRSYTDPVSARQLHRVIQGLLGHSKIDTTALYAKVGTRTIHAVTSLLDRLMALMEGKAPAG